MHDHVYKLVNINFKITNINSHVDVEPIIEVSI